MRGPIRSVLLAALAVCAFGALAGQASAALLGQPGNTAFYAIYGFPGASSDKPAAETAIGGGLGRNFGFGENMLFQAGNGVGTKLSITLASGIVARARESYIGGTLMSNKTGKNNPLSFAIQFVDFQDNAVLTPTETKIQSLADTYDRPWISEICSPEAGTACKVDPRIVNNANGEVKIENVSFDIGPSTATSTGTVVQGTVWGKWKNGEAKKCPGISINLPIAAVEADTLYVTQATAGVSTVGEKITAISGEACLISANNDWYSIAEAPAEKEEPAITLKNTE
jgi:hypothetical protein